MLRLTPPPPPAGAAAGQKWRSSANPPHAERIQVGVDCRGTGERVPFPLMCPVPFPELELSEQPATRLKNAAQASMAPALTHTP
jgi:hypothetical protein